jgi:hypothetical protein
MKHRSCTAVVISSLLALACGRGASSPPKAPRAAPSGPVTTSLSDAPAESGYGYSFQESAPAPAAPKSALDDARAGERSFEPAPERERPGLGTSWGETRFSRVSSAPFQRAESRPFAGATLFYNDEPGVRAMARRTGQGFFDLQRSGVELGRGAVSVRLLDGSGNPLPAFDVGGRNYVVGQDGERYTIQITNRTGNRFEAVTTVDGLDVIDGRPGSLDKRGYLLNPFATLEIDGFRQSVDEVAAFRFGAVKDSYAAKKGEDRNVGVIGVALFQEAGSPLPWTDREVDRRLDADPFPQRFATPPRF